MFYKLNWLLLVINRYSLTRLLTYELASYNRFDCSKLRILVRAKENYNYYYLLLFLTPSALQFFCPSNF